MNIIVSITISSFESLIRNPIHIKHKSNQILSNPGYIPNPKSMIAEFAKFAPTYVNGFTGCFGMYGLQMLFMPDKMVTDHFDAPATPLMKFWIRGQSVSILAMCYAIQQIPDVKTQVTIGAISSLAVGILYPWNAKFGYLTDGRLPTKYPMHYVPEFLMLGLTVLGGLVFMGME